MSNVAQAVAQRVGTGFAQTRAPVDVSVCIANWNCIDLLRGCLASLHRQDQGVRLETIVVDNASTDGAADMVEREFPEVRLIRNSANLGFSRANNQAANDAQGRFLFFLNNDTVVPPGTMRQLLAHAVANPSASMVGPLLRDGRGDVQTSYRRRPTVGVLLHRTLLLRWTGLFRKAYRSYRREVHVSSEPQPVEVLMGAALVVSRRNFEQMGRWDERFHFGGEDLELCLRAQQLGPILYLPKVEITHFGRASTRRHIAFACTKINIGFVQYLRKSGATRPALLAYKLALTLDAPLQIAAKGLQYLFRRLQGRPDEADKSLTILRGQVPFLLHGLPAFWAA